MIPVPAEVARNIRNAVAKINRKICIGTISNRVLRVHFTRVSARFSIIFQNVSAILLIPAQNVLTVPQSELHPQSN